MAKSIRLKVLVVGGAGYIGAHVVRVLAERGHTPIILDDFRASSPDRVGNFLHEHVALEETSKVMEVFQKHEPDAVVHLGGYISVGESVREPEKYWENNLGAGFSLLLACAKFRIGVFLFSSTAAVYGNVIESPIRENATLKPTSPYGSSKLAFERALHRTAQAAGFRSVALRYFNAAGAHLDWRVGESHDPEEHLIPRVIQAMHAKRTVQVYGSDYPTPDGTCVRDYIHVLDLAEAHVLALEAEHLSWGHSWNVGTGRGYSVLEVIRAIGKELGVTPRIDILSRRPGDPPWLEADPSKLKAELKWKPIYSNLEYIVHSAVKWEQSRKQDGARL